jgi:hypothetical protein
LAWCLDLASWQYTCSWRGRSISGIFLNWTIHYIRQIWPRLTFGYSQNWRLLWRVTDFQTLPTFRDMRRLSCRAFQKRSSRNVLSSANTDSLSVLLRKETTSKVTATFSV